MTDRPAGPPPARQPPPPRLPRPQPRRQRPAVGVAVFAVLAGLVVVLLVGIAIERDLLTAITRPPSAGPAGSVDDLPPLIEDAALAALFRAPPTQPLVTSAGAASVLVEAGPSILLPDGRLVAGDVFFLGDQRPFTGALPAGETAVTFLVARFAEDRRIAAVIVGDATAELRWAPAVTEGQAPPAPGEVNAFPVDSGTAGFTSVDGVSRAANDAGYSDRALEALETAGFDEAVVFPLDDSRTLQVLAVPSGWGNGSYVTWVGTDEAGTVRAFLTSFDVLDLPDAPS